MTPVMTIGYEGANIEEFLRVMSDSRITLLIDIREIPLSRKKGFSKNALRVALQNMSLNYLHVKQLGDPKPGREAARRGDIASFRRIYANHLLGEETKQALEMVADHAQAEQSCLMCFEREPAVCHRSLVATAIKLRTAMPVEHLYVPLCPLARREPERRDVLSALG